MPAKPKIKKVTPAATKKAAAAKKAPSPNAMAYKKANAKARFKR